MSDVERPAVKRIASRQNPVVLRYRAVARGEAPGLLLDGPHLVRDALRAGLTIRSVLVSDAHEGTAAIATLLGRLARQDIECLTASASVMAAVSPVRSSSPIVALADPLRVEPGALYTPAPPMVVIACDVQDPGNLGAIVRVAEAAGATGVVAAGQSADPWAWKTLRGSMGSALRLPALRRSIADAVASARAHDCRLVAAIPRGGRALFDADLTGPLAVLIGGEGPGLADALVEAADLRVTIPMQAPVESLNAAVAAALLVYEARRQRTASRQA